MIANDAVHAFLYQPQWITVANKNIRGLWEEHAHICERPVSTFMVMIRTDR